MKNLYKVCMVILAILMLLCGCAQPQPEEDVDYEKLVVPPVDLAITDCIDDQQLTSVLGHSMQLMGVYEDGTQAIWVSDDGACQVTIHMMNQTRALFDAQVTESESAMTLQEGFGEVAYWYEGRTEMMLYYNGYAIDVAVVCSDTPLTEPYVRQIAAMMAMAVGPEQN